MRCHLKITYLYTADGRKLSETITDGQMTHTFDYCGNMVYEDGLLSYILNPAGRALPTGQAHEYSYEYFLHDHLGNVRVVFGDPDRDHEAEVIQENHYYPFGMTMAGLDYSAGLENRYLYQGKERTGDFNLWWSDFHARRFDSQLGRWHVPDPAGQFASAYVGMGNNPVSLTDLDGMWAVGGRNIRWMGGIVWDGGSIFQRQLDIFYGRTSAALDDFDHNFIPEGGAGGRTGGGNPGNPYEKNRDVLAGVNTATYEMFPAVMDPETRQWGFEYTRINPFPAFYPVQGQIRFFPLCTEVEHIWVDLSKGYSSQRVDNEQGGGVPGWGPIIGTASAIAGEMYYSKTYGTWMGKNFKMYQQTWGGNGATGGKFKFGKKVSTGIKLGGYGLGIWNAYKIDQQNRAGQLTGGQMYMEQGSNLITTVGGIYGAAWGVGWELGRAVSSMEWYQEAKFNFWYNRWESQIGTPSQSNEALWYYFYQNYIP